MIRRAIITVRIEKWPKAHHADLVELQRLYARPAPPVEWLEGNSAKVVVVNALEVGRPPQYMTRLSIDEARPSAAPDDLNHQLTGLLAQIVQLMMPYIGLHLFFRWFLRVLES